MRNSGIAALAALMETGGRRELGCTATRLAEQQRIVGAEANRFAMLTRLRRARGTFTSETSELFKPETANLSLSLGVPKGGFSFAKENPPFDPCSAARAAIPFAPVRNR